MISPIRRSVAMGLVALALAACAAQPSAQTMMQPSYAQLPTLGLAVSEVQIVSDFTAPMTAPHVEDKMPVSLETQMRDWAAGRLAARGGDAIARFTIVDASVVENLLQEDAGVPGLMRAPQDVRYDAAVAATLEIVDRAGNRLGYTNARAAHSTTYTRSLSDESFRMRMEDVAFSVMPGFNAAMERNIRDHLGAYLVP